jgi:hypothetical protein
MKFLSNHQASFKTTLHVGITLSHTPAITLPSSFTHVVINITITKAPCNAPGLPAIKNKPLYKEHHMSAGAKFVGTNPNVIADINSAGIVPALHH